jgi:hypothetical protein
MPPPTLLVRRGDVEERELVGALFVIGLGDLHGIARVAQVYEAYAFHDPTRLHIEAGDDSLG